MKNKTKSSSKKDKTVIINTTCSIITVLANVTVLVLMLIKY